MLFNENDPALARRYGTLISVAAGLLGLIYAIGIARRSYWALALPLTAAMAGLVAGGVALGRLLSTTPDEPPDPTP